jgi:hypothetical protein
MLIAPLIRGRWLGERRSPPVSDASESEELCKGNQNEGRNNTP